MAMLRNAHMVRLRPLATLCYAQGCAYHDGGTSVAVPGIIRPVDVRKIIGRIDFDASDAGVL